MQSALRAPLRWELFAIPGAALIAVGVVFAAGYVFTVLGAVALVFLLSRGPLMRTTIVIVGGLTIFQISAGLTIEKVAYLGVLVVAMLFAGRHIAFHWSPAKTLGVQPILLATGAVALVVAISPLVALHSGITIMAWALDVPAYGMIVAGVVIGLDLALSNQSPRRIATILVLAGLVAAVGYTVYWLERRGLSDFGLGRIVGVSTFLPAAAFCLALAYIFAGRHPYWMALLAMLMILATLLSGSRILILLAVPIVVTIGVARGRRHRVVALIAGAGFALALLGGLLTLTGATQFLNLDLVWARLAGIVPVLISQDPTVVDQSLYLRALEARVLQAAWLQDPIFGAGPGGVYSYAYVVNTKPVDSSFAILARFGIIGTSAFIVSFWTLLISKLRRGAHWVPATALLAFIGLIAAWSLVSSPLDDKGVALGLIPLIGLCGVWRKKSV